MISLSREPSVTYTPSRMMECEGGDEKCWHPAPYVVRDFRHRVTHLCIKHLEQSRRKR